MPEEDALDSEFNEFAKEQAKKHSFQPNQLLSVDVLQKRYEKELIDEFRHYRKQQAAGAVAIMHSLAEVQELLTPEVLEGISQISGLYDAILQDEKKFQEELSNGKTIQDIAGINDAVMEALYQGAKRLYEKQLFADASSAFHFLTSLNSKQYHFWQGLACAELQQKHYKEAFDAFQILLEVNPNDISLQQALNECHKGLGKE